MQNTNVPNGWVKTTLGKVGEVSMCKRIMKHQTNDVGGVPFFKIGTFGGIADAYIDKALFYEYKKKYSYPNIGDILLSAAGTIGRLVIFDGNDAYFQDSNIVWVSNNEKLVINKYLYYLYRIIKWRTSEGGIVSRLYNNEIRKTEIVIPPLEEQKKIAEILGTWDRAIEELTDLIAEKKELKRGLMQRLLTGTQRLPGFTRPWNQKKILEFVHVGKIIIEKGKTLTAEQLNTGDIPVIAGGKTVPYYHDKYTHDIPCVTVSASGAYAGYVWWHNSKIWASDCNVLYGVNFDTRFLGLCLENMQKQIYRMQTGGAQPHVYADSIKTLKIPDVDLAEQKAIADVLSKADAEIDLLNQQLNVLREQKRGLMQKLLTGEIRVKVDNE